MEKEKRVPFYLQPRLGAFGLLKELVVAAGGGGAGGGGRGGSKGQKRQQQEGEGEGEKVLAAAVEEEVCFVLNACIFFLRLSLSEPPPKATT
jgi:hypothetical protein